MIWFSGSSGVKKLAIFNYSIPYYSIIVSVKNYKNKLMEAFRYFGAGFPSFFLFFQPGYSNFRKV